MMPPPPFTFNLLFILLDCIIYFISLSASVGVYEYVYVCIYIYIYIYIMCMCLHSICTAITFLFVVQM